MPSALLALTCSLLKKSFECFRLHVNIKSRPFGLVDERKHPFEIDRIVKARLCAGKNVSQQAVLLPQRSQNIDIVVCQIGSRLLVERWPVTLLWQLNAPLVCHLEKQKISNLLDVVAVVDAVVTKCVAEAPQFLNDVRHVSSCPFLLNLNRFKRPGGPTEISRVQAQRSSRNDRI